MFQQAFKRIDDILHKDIGCIPIVSANVAETAILNFDACFNDSVIGIQVIPQNANIEYVDFLLQKFKSYLNEKGKGTARDSINLGTFEIQKFPFPTLNEQHTIVHQLKIPQEEMQKLKSVNRKKIDDLEELKKNLLNNAFNGAK